MITNLLVFTGADCYYPVSMVNLFWLTNEKRSSCKH